MQTFQDEILFPRLVGNMRFVGMYYMITGILACLTIVGAIIGVPIFIAGSRLRDAAENLRVYGDSRSEETLNRALNLQNSSFFIYKIIILVSIVLFVLYAIGIILFIGSAAFSNFPRV